MRRLTTLLVLACCCAGASAKQLPVEARLLWEFPSPGMTPVDLNGDSTDELLVYDGDNYLVGRDQQLVVASASRRFTADTRRAGLPFAVNETLMWAPRIRNDSLFQYPLWRGRGTFCFTLPTPGPGDFWDGGVSEMAMRDMDGDSAPELVVLVIAGFAKWPRGVAAFDMKTGRRRWFFETGPSPEALVLRDVDGDGTVEVMFGSMATGNGHKVAGSDDSQSYVFCLRHDGSPMWQREVGRYGQTASIEWFDNRLLLHEQGSRVEDAEPDSIFILDPLTGTTRTAAQLGSFGRGVATFGDTLIVSAATDDTLRVFDRSLRITQKRALGTIGAAGIHGGSFTATGRNELVVTTIGGDLQLVDASLKSLARTDVGSQPAMFTVAHAGRQRLLVGLTPGPKCLWCLYEFNRLPLLRRQVSMGTLLAGAGVFLLVFVVAFIGLRARQNRDIRAVVRGLTGHAGVVELDWRGRLTHANPKGRELLLAAGATESAPFSGSLAPLDGLITGTAARELPLSLPGGQTVLARATPLKSGLLLTLEDISAVEYMKRVTAWAPVAQKLAHDIKNPLSTIRLKAQQMEEEGAVDASTIQEEVDRLSKMVDGFARLANFKPLKLEQTEINTLVHRVVEEQGLNLRPGLVVKLDLQTGLPLLNLDEEQMARALANLVTNAIAAMAGRGVLTVRTRTVNDGTHVALDVADTGPGIPDEYRAKLFQPFFTRKQGGTGLGLTIARKVVEDHGGTIEVESELGKGSTFSIVLQAGKTVGTESA